jgi:hypothetical protein
LNDNSHSALNVLKLSLHFGILLPAPPNDLEIAVVTAHERPQFVHLVAPAHLLAFVPQAIIKFGHVFAMRYGPLVLKSVSPAVWGSMQIPFVNGFTQ